MTQPESTGVSLVDTHCHIHEIIRRLTPVYDKWPAGKPMDADTVIREAHTAGVERMICVGTSAADSELAIEFVVDRPGLYASIGIHPHEAAHHRDAAVQAAFAELAIAHKVVAVGECGLDYFYDHSPREAQRALLELQLDVATRHRLPVIFHVREAFTDFWPLLDNFPGITGVLHSFTDTRNTMEQAVARGLYIGVNGIATFTKDPDQVAMYRAIPLDNVLLETDAPFLTPTPYRGTINEPKYVRVTAEFLAGLRQESLEQLAETSSQNARTLFGLD